MVLSSIWLVSKYGKFTHTNVEKTAKFKFCSILVIFSITSTPSENGATPFWLPCWKQDFGLIMYEGGWKLEGS